MITRTKALADIFADARASCLEWDGEPAYAIYEMAAPSAFDVEFFSATDTPIQGLTLKVYGGVLAIDGVEAPEMVLWRDTAPDRVPVTVRPEPRLNPRLKIWNVWRGNVGGHYVTQAWLGNAAMRVDQSKCGLSFRCSDGEGPVNFGDLTTKITIFQ